ncbi:hypothetical protein D1007_17761 [Hordeum vulgare]|nr:hypothetical protein D1007_17761 [Hordeum vulgare]
MAGLEVDRGTIADDVPLILPLHLRRSAPSLPGLLERGYGALPDPHAPYPPNSIFLLATFAYLCEGFLGVIPLLGLFRTFYSMRGKEGSTMGWTSFWIADHMSERFIEMTPLKKMENLGACFIYMEVGQCNPMFEPPMRHAVKSSAWGVTSLAPI